MILGQRQIRELAAHGNALIGCRAAEVRHTALLSYHGFVIVLGVRYFVLCTSWHYPCTWAAVKQLPTSDRSAVNGQGT